MKWKINSIVLLFAATTLFVLGCRSGKEIETHSNIKFVTISAHRGGPLEGFPENALETLKNTSKTVDGIMMEIDVLPTLDSVLVLMHDKRLDRTTNLTGYLKDHTLADVKKGVLIDKHSTLTNFKVPTLQEVFDWVKTENAFLSLDVKDKTTFCQVVDLIREYKILNKVEIITYSLQDAEQVHDYDSEINLSVSVGSLKVLEKLLASKVNISRVAAFTGLSIKDRLFYQKLRKNGIVVTLGTIGNLDNRAKVRGFQLYSDWSKLGIDRFATDNYTKVHQALYTNSEKSFR
ncbi:MAG: glycerophosphodiester phosphodiesterase family protein [Bacteroidota bacterium]